MKLLYLTIDIVAVAIPLLFSFHPKIVFYKTWNALFTAIIFVAVPFLIFDSLFTAHGVWSFNPVYVSGIFIFNLPIEEILFFICIPYSCLFTYYCLNKFYNLSWHPKAENIFCSLFSIVLLITGIIFRHKLYTSSTSVSTAIICLILKYALNINWFGKAVSVYTILIFPFLLVNGILTGTGLLAPVVIYNPLYNLGIRVMTIPIEDFFYGFELFLLNLSLYLKFNDSYPLGHAYNKSAGKVPEIRNNNNKYKVE
jgi:lycopene cyclase domain-containing protein